MRLASVAVGGLLALCALPVHAQFFQHMFQQGGAGHNFFHTGGEQEAHAVGDASWFQERVRNGASRVTDTAKCNDYLCSDTLACVSEPSECPCPYAEQTRCKVGDSFVCVTSVDCRLTQRLYHLSE